MKLLITGISSQLGRLVAKVALARGHNVIGLDKRPWPAAPRGIEMHAVELQKRAGEDVFRTRRPDAVEAERRLYTAGKAASDEYLRLFAQHFPDQLLRAAILIKSLST